MSDDQASLKNMNKLLAPEPPKHGSTLGIIIIILLLLMLGAYFGLVRLEERRKATQQISFIPAATTTITLPRTR